MALTHPYTIHRNRKDINMYLKMYMLNKYVIKGNHLILYLKFINLGIQEIWYHSITVRKSVQWLIVSHRAML